MTSSVSSYRNSSCVWSSFLDVDPETARQRSPTGAVWSHRVGYARSKWNSLLVVSCCEMCWSELSANAFDAVCWCASYSTVHVAVMKVWRVNLEGCLLRCRVVGDILFALINWAPSCLKHSRLVVVVASTRYTKHEEGGSAATMLYAKRLLLKCSCVVRSSDTY